MEKIMVAGEGSAPITNEMAAVPSCDRDKIVCPYALFADKELDRLHRLAYAPDGKEHRRVVFEQAAEIDRLKAERMKLDRRIHNQRRANRETWEIVEERRKWLGSDTARRLYVSLLKRYREARAENAKPSPPYPFGSQPFI